MKTAEDIVIDKKADIVSVGMISIGDVLRANLLEKEQQFKDINAFVNWDYYENWKWGRKKRS